MASMTLLERRHIMRRIAFALVAVAALAGAVSHMPPASGQADGAGCPDLRGHAPLRIPRLALDLRGPRKGNLNDLRAILGNDVAIKAARGKDVSVPWMAPSLPGSHGLITPLEESEKAFGRPQSFVAGPPKNGVQFMVRTEEICCDRRLGLRSLQ